jgi:hypothetical protein
MAKLASSILHAVRCLHDPPIGGAASAIQDEGALHLPR